ncbi:MAG TPA: hypothetical protein VMF65_17865 [Acidimicrobiales bacterium]|nr:hypothetical protein [Acidimicrobiales bacterium]
MDLAAGGGLLARTVMAGGHQALKRATLASMTMTALVFSVLAGVPGPGATAAAASARPAGLTALTVTPHTGLTDGEQVTVGVTSGSYGTIYAVADCDPTAVSLLLQPGASVQDGCDSRHNAVMAVDRAGVASTTLRLPAVLTTALGAANCLKVKCFVAIEALHSTGGLPTLFQDLAFTAKACALPGSCTTPADAWDPSLGPSTLSSGSAPTAAGTEPAGAGPGQTAGTPPAGSVEAGPGHPVTLSLHPTVAGNLTTTGSVTGPFSGAFTGPPTGQPVPTPSPVTTAVTPGISASTTAPVTTASPASPSQASPSQASPSPATPAASTTNLSTAPSATTSPVTVTSTPAPSASGEGLLRLALEAPGTSWGPGPPSSTVVDVALTDLTTHQAGPKQQLVLFWGAAPFVYAAFAGPVVLSHSYSLTLSVEPPAARGGLSRPGPGLTPQVVLLGGQLEVVSPGNSQYLAYAYAPVMYGRSTSALHDVPLLAYADVSPAAGGASVLTYVIVWSHEDAGTGFLPFLEWGTWGRMTDIENAISFTVRANGTVTAARYLWGGEPSTRFPDSQTALQEVDKPFAGKWWGHHPVLRDATGNNDFSDQGTTSFRFQLAPVAAPSAGQARDAVMDANPFTYEVMANELARWYADISTDPASPEPGQAQQYAIVDLTTAGKGVSSVAVNLQLSGYPGWFRSDLGWGYPLVSTGHVRTVVKLPLGWATSRVTGLQVAVEPPSAAAGVKVRSLRIERFTGSVVQPVPVPAAVVVPEALDIRPAP